MEDRDQQFNGPNEDDLRAPHGALKQEAGKIITGQLGNSLPEQQPKSLTGSL